MVSTSPPELPVTNHKYPVRVLQLEPFGSQLETIERAQNARAQLGNQKFLQGSYSKGFQNGQGTMNQNQTQPQNKSKYAFAAVAAAAAVQQQQNHLLHTSQGFSAQGDYANYTNVPQGYLGYQSQPLAQSKLGFLGSLSQNSQTLPDGRLQNYQGQRENFSLQNNLGRDSRDTYSGLGSISGQTQGFQNNQALNSGQAQGFQNGQSAQGFENGQGLNSARSSQSGFGLGQSGFAGQSVLNGGYQNGLGSFAGQKNMNQASLNGLQTPTFASKYQANDPILLSGGQEAIGQSALPIDLKNYMVFNNSTLSLSSPTSQAQTTNNRATKTQQGHTSVQSTPLHSKLFDYGESGLVNSPLKDSPPNLFLNTTAANKPSLGNMSPSFLTPLNAGTPTKTWGLAGTNTAPATPASNSIWGSLSSSSMGTGSVGASSVGASSLGAGSMGLGASSLNGHGLGSLSITNQNVFGSPSVW